MNFFHGRVEQRNGGLVFNEGTFALKLEDRLASRVAAYVGKEVVFGIRPEDIADALYAGNPGSAQEIRAKVEVVEPMGAEVFIYLNTGNNPFIARVDAHDKTGVDQELKILLDMKKAHFFDADSGKSLV